MLACVCISRSTSRDARSAILVGESCDWWRRWIPKETTRSGIAPNPDEMRVHFVGRVVADTAGAVMHLFARDVRAGGRRYPRVAERGCAMGEAQMSAQGQVGS